MDRSLILTVILFVGIADLAQAASIEYPAPGNLRLDEGTIELWLTPMTELYAKQPPSKYQRAFSLFSLRIPEHFSMSAAWGSKGDKAQVSVSLNAVGVENGLLPVPAQAPRNWKQGERHHIAFTWRGQEMKLFFDGRESGGRKQQLCFTGPLAERTLLIGDPDSRDCRIILHAVRVSCVARTDAPQPMADIYTLLFDAFDHQTKTQVISGFSGERGGTIKGAHHFTPNGLALFAPPKGERK